MSAVCIWHFQYVNNKSSENNYRENIRLCTDSQVSLVNFDDTQEINSDGDSSV